MTALSTLLNAAMDDSRRKRRKKGRKVARRRNAKGHFLKGPVRKYRSADAALFAAIGLDGAKRKRKATKLDGAAKKRKPGPKKGAKKRASCSKELVAVFNKFCKYEQELKKKEAQAKAAEEFRKTAAKISSWTDPTFMGSRSRRRGTKRKARR